MLCLLDAGSIHDGRHVDDAGACEGILDYIVFAFDRLKIDIKLENVV